MSHHQFVGTVEPSGGNKFSYNCEKTAYNRRIVWTIIPNFPEGSPLSLMPRRVEGSVGEYTITYIFAVPGESQFFSDFDNLDQKGDSQITLGTIPNIQVSRNPGSADLQFELSPNPQGNLARATVKVTATNFDHADVISHALVTPLLSLLCFRCDCGLEICARYLSEIATGTIRVVVFSLGQTKPWPFEEGEAIGPLNLEIAPLLAVYREAMNAQNPFFQFLCFYKVTEGAQNLRPLRNKKMKEAGKTISQPEGERFPASIAEMNVDSVDENSFVPYLGKTFGFVRDQMRSVLRNAVAHMDAHPTSASADDLINITTCEKAIPVIKYIAQKMIEHEMSLAK